MMGCRHSPLRHQNLIFGGKDEPGFLAAWPEVIVVAFSGVPCAWPFWSPWPLPVVVPRFWKR